MPLSQRELSTELHKVQTKLNSTEESLRKELEEQKMFVQVLRIGFMLIGGVIIAFDVVKDALCQSEHLQYNVGMGWQQWALLVFGFVLVGIGIYKKPGGK